MTKGVRAMSITKKKAIYDFFSSFGIPAYEEHQLFAEMPLPYLTYSYSAGSFRDGEISGTVKIWYDDSSDWEDADSVERLILDKLGSSGYITPCEGGGILIKRGKPVSKNNSDGRIRQKQMNIVYEFITNG